MTVAVLPVAPIVASAAPIWITDMIGDDDGYSYVAAFVPDGTDLPMTADPQGSWVFDNRSAAELATTDGAQYTDWEPYIPQYVGDPPRVSMFYHTFDASQFAYNDAVEYCIDISDVQTVSNGPSYLYFDGVQVLGAFSGVDQGAWGSGAFTFAVNTALVADGALTVVVETYDDHVAYDYSKLKVHGEPMPEPATLFFLGGGLVGVAVARRRRKNA